MFEGLKQSLTIGQRSLTRSYERIAPYIVFGTGHRWLDWTLGVVFFVIGIALVVLILGEIGREIGLWIPKWDRQEVSSNLPGWAIVIFYAEILVVVGIRSYCFFRPQKSVYKQK